MNAEYYCPYGYHYYVNGVSVTRKNFMDTMEYMAKNTEEDSRVRSSFQFYIAEPEPEKRVG